MANLQTQFKNLFTELIAAPRQLEARTLDEIYSDAGFRATKDIADAIKKLNHPDLHASFTTLRHWATGRSTIRAKNLNGIMLLCQLLQTDPIELWLASRRACAKFDERYPNNERVQRDGKQPLVKTLQIAELKPKTRRETTACEDATDCGTETKEENHGPPLVKTLQIVELKPKKKITGRRRKRGTARALESLRKKTELP